MKAIIIGAGIGGLTAAIALEQVGVEAHIYERAVELREVGAGISLWANAVRALDVLGLTGSLHAHGWSRVRADVRTWTGDVLVPAPPDAQSSGSVMVGALHRAELLDLLRDAVDPGRVHLSRECTGFESDGRQVTARFADGATVTGDILIGAGGLYSVVRKQLVDATAPTYAGYTAWRSVIDVQGPDMGSESWGCGQRFGIVPLSGARVYWFATRNAPEREREAPGAVKPKLMQLFRGWHAPIEALLEATPESAILRNDIYDREPLPSWTAGRVALLGDSAHPMTPNLGQGACQAIEDAIVLAACLARSSDVEAALQRYETRRKPRTRRVLLLSRRIGRIGQWQQPLACRVRNLLIRATPAWVNERQIRSVVDEEILTTEERAMFARSH